MPGWPPCATCAREPYCTIRKAWEAGAPLPGDLAEPTRARLAVELAAGECDLYRGPVPVVNEKPPPLNGWREAHKRRLNSEEAYAAVARGAASAAPTFAGLTRSREHAWRNYPK